MGLVHRVREFLHREAEIFEAGFAAHHGVHLDERTYEDFIANRQRRRERAMRRAGFHPQHVRDDPENAAASLQRPAARPTEDARE